MIPLSSMIDELVEKYVNMVIGDDQGPSEWNLKELNEILHSDDSS
ncbi:MAG: hypothetical protein ACLSG9_01670 [Eubacterium sp.]